MQTATDASHSPLCADGKDPVAVSNSQGDVFNSAMSEQGGVMPISFGSLDEPPQPPSQQLIPVQPQPPSQPLIPVQPQPPSQQLIPVPVISTAALQQAVNEADARLVHAEARIDAQTPMVELMPQQIEAVAESASVPLSQIFVPVVNQTESGPIIQLVPLTPESCMSVS